MHVEVIKLATVYRLQNDVRGGMRGETEKPDTSLLLQLPGSGDTTILSQGEMEQLAIIDAMQGQEVHLIHPQVAH